ncbi:ribosomal protein L1 [Hysterangium stoloniferum]|nr:ribosomal protein L1 [Hysterangium stoloniferum]
MLSICRQASARHVFRSDTSLFPRFISTTAPAMARKRQVKPPPSISKKKLQAKERRREIKRALKTQSLYENEKMTLLDAIRTLRAVEIAHPNATYELVIKTMLGRGSVPPRGRISLPFAPKPAKDDRILVFADGRAADAARSAGADIVGGMDLVDGVISGRHQANVILATPALVKLIAPRLGRILGPRGLMPTERRGTVLEDPATYIRKLKGSNQWAGDKAGTIRTPIGKVNFPEENLLKNVRFFIDSVKKAIGRPEGEKSGARPTVTISRIVLSSQQGPGITISDVA